MMNTTACSLAGGWWRAASSTVYYVRLFQLDVGGGRGHLLQQGTLVGQEQYLQLGVEGVDI